MLEQSFWTFLGYVTAVGCLWLIFAIGVGDIVGRCIRFGNPSDERPIRDFDGEWR